MGCHNSDNHGNNDGRRGDPNELRLRYHNMNRWLKGGIKTSDSERANSLQNYAGTED